MVLRARGGQALAQAVEEIEAARGSGSGGWAASAASLNSPLQARRLWRSSLQRFGAIDIVINNAGATKRGEFETLSDEDWADGFALKFFGAVRLTRAAWPHLKCSAGSLLFISRTGGERRAAVSSTQSLAAARPPQQGFSWSCLSASHGHRVPSIYF